MVIYVTIILNFVIFIITLFNKNFMLENFALFNGGKAYTFFTYSFLHSDFQHLIMNMAMLFILGQLLKNYNQLIIAIIYVSGAIISAILYYFYKYYINDLFLLVGASGAICAIFGFASVVFRQVGFLIALLVGNIISIIFFSNIAWQAHIIGFIYGCLCAYFIKLNYNTILFVFKKRR